MYTCYACGREIEKPGDSCPFCRFPVVSTLHGDKDEEEQIRQFAEEYRQTNPQFFQKIQPKSGVSEVHSEPTDHVRTEMNGSSGQKVPEGKLSVSEAGKPGVSDDAREWKRKYEELLKKEEEREAKKRQETEKRNQALIRQRQQEAAARAEKVLEEQTRKKKKKTLGRITLLLFAAVAIWFILTQTDLLSGSKAQKTTSGTADAAAADSTAAEQEPEETRVVSKLSSSVNVGDIVSFGSYEQDNDTSDGKEAISWLVLAKENGRVLLISEYGLDCRQFHDKKTAVSWEDCTLRSWLNTDFLSAAFSEEEQAAIPAVSVNMDRMAAGSSGENTEDRVFLLSVTEAKTYFSSGTSRQCMPTKYALSKSCYTNEAGYGYWWLRSRGNQSNYAARVMVDGAVNLLGAAVNSEQHMVRPALWVETK